MLLVPFSQLSDLLVLLSNCGHDSVHHALGGFLAFPIPVQNQFFALANLDLEEPFALCAPSVKTVPEPGVVAGLACGMALLAGLDRMRRRPERVD